MGIKAKRNLAVIGVGIVGAGSLDQGIPAMIKGLIKLQELYSITIYSCIPVDRTKAPEGIRVRCIPTGKMPLKVKYMYLILLFIKDHLTKRYALIHAQSPYPAGMLSVWMNTLLGIPWVLSLHAGETARMPEISFGDLLNPHLEKAAIETCKKADLVMAMSQFQADITKQNLQLNREVFVLPRGIDVNFPLGAKSLNPPFRFLHISNYHPVKDYETLLRAFASIASHISSELIIAGSNYSDDVKALITSLRLEEKVKLVGPVPNERLDTLFSTSHILLHTSRFEGLPMVALEAMAHGVLVCGTHVGVMADLSGRYCITVPTGEHEQLAKEVIKILGDKDRYNHLREEAYTWIKAHDLQWFVSELHTLYSKVI